MITEEVCGEVFGGTWCNGLPEEKLTFLKKNVVRIQM